MTCSELREIKRSGVFLILALGSACNSPTSITPELAQSTDASGCVLEHVAVELGTNQYQYDSFSPDGSSIAIAWDRGENNRGTYLLDLQTFQRTDVPTLNNGATFSPDGRFLLNSVYVSEQNTDIARYEIATEIVTIYAPHDAWDWLPSYSADGRQVVFNSFRSGNSDVYLLDIESGMLNKLSDSPYYEAHAQLSPDGRSIVYHRQVSRTDFNLILLDVSTGEETTLTEQATEESYPSWSPDGNYIAFASDRDQQPGTTDIFIMARSGEVLHKITDTPHKDAYPFWSPDGTYLYFTSYREPQGVYRTQLSKFINCKR